MAPSPSVDARFTTRPSPLRRRCGSAARTMSGLPGEVDRERRVATLSSKSAPSIGSGDADAGVVDEDVERAESVHHLGNHGADLVGRRDIERPRLATTSLRHEPMPRWPPLPHRRRRSRRPIAPSPASRRAVARPIPLAAPVTSATFPATERASEREGRARSDHTSEVSTVAVSGTHMLWVIVVTVFAAIPLGLSAWAFLDTAHRPSWAWALSRHRQVAWLVGHHVRRAARPGRTRDLAVVPAQGASRDRRRRTGRRGALSRRSTYRAPARDRPRSADGHHR